MNNHLPNNNIKKLMLSIPKIERSKNSKNNKTSLINYTTAQNTQELYNKALDSIFNISEICNNNSAVSPRNKENIYTKYKNSISGKNLKNEDNEIDPTISIFNESFAAKCARNNNNLQMAGNSFLTNNNNSFNILCKEEERQIGINDSPFNYNLNNSNQYYNGQLKRTSEENSYDKNVVDLFAELDLAEFIDNFKENKIYFNDLILLSKEDLIELKLPLGPRNRLLKFIQDYQKENNVQKDFIEDDLNNALEENYKINKEITSNSSLKNLSIEPNHYQNNNEIDLKQSNTSPYFNDNKLFCDNIKQFQEESNNESSLYHTNKNIYNSNTIENIREDQNSPNCEKQINRPVNKIYQKIKENQEFTAKESDRLSNTINEITNYKEEKKIENLNNSYTNVSINKILMDKHNEIIKSRKNIKKQFVMLNDIVSKFKSNLKEVKNKSIQRNLNITKILNKNSINQKSSFYFNKNSQKCEKQENNTIQNDQLEEHQVEEIRNLNQELIKSSKINMISEIGSEKGNSSSGVESVDKLKLTFKNFHNLDEREYEFPNNDSKNSKFNLDNHKIRNQFLVNKNLN